MANAAALITLRDVHPLVSGAPSEESAIKQIDQSCFTELDDQGHNKPHGALGVESLPDTMFRALNAEPLIRTTGQYNLLAPRDSIPNLDDLVDTSTLISAADDVYLNASDVPVKLVEQVSALAAEMRLPHGNFVTLGDGAKVSDHEVADSMSQILRAVGTRPAVVWRMLVKDAHKNGASNISDTVFAPLLAFDWDESTQQQQPIVDALGTISDPKLLFADPGRESRAMGVTEAARKSSAASSDLMTVIGLASDEFLNIPGRGRTSLGVINPDIVDALARAIGPQLLSMTGGVDGELGFPQARAVDETAYRGAFEVLGTSVESYKDMWIAITDTQSMIFVSYGRAHGGDPNKYVAPDQYVAAIERLKDGSKGLILHSASTMLAEGLIDDVLELLDGDLKYEPKRSFFRDRPASNSGNGHDYLRPISNPTVVISSAGFSSSTSVHEKLRDFDEILASEDYGEFEERLLDGTTPPHYKSPIAQLSLLSTIPESRYGETVRIDDEVLEQLSDPTSLDISREWSDTSDVVHEITRPMTKTLREYNR